MAAFSPLASNVFSCCQRPDALIQPRLYVELKIGNEKRRSCHQIPQPASFRLIAAYFYCICSILLLQ